MTTDRTAAPVRPTAPPERSASADRSPAAGGFAEPLGGAHAASSRPAARAASRPREQVAPPQERPAEQPATPTAPEAPAAHAGAAPQTYAPAAVPFVLAVATPPATGPAAVAVTVAPAAEAQPAAPAAAGPAARPAPAGAVAASARVPAPAVPAAAAAGTQPAPAPMSAPAAAPAWLGGLASPSVFTQRTAPLHHAPRVVGTLLQVAHERGITHAKISLRPGDLGGIEVRLQSTPTGVTAQIVADAPEAARLLALAGDDLRRSLEARAVNLLSLEVSTSGDQRQGERPGQTSDPNTPAGVGGAPSDSGEADGDDVASAPAPVSILELPGGLLVDVLA